MGEKVEKGEIERIGRGKGEKERRGMKRERKESKGQREMRMLKVRKGGGEKTAETERTKES